jgi:hypothetical protein
MPKRYPLTERDSDCFEKNVLYWVKRLGLMDWRLGFSWMDDDSDLIAQLRYDVVNRTAEFSLNRSLSFRKTMRDLRRTAFHEALELLHCQLEAAAEARYIGQTEIREQVHALIRTWENVFFDLQDGPKGKARR